MKRSILATFAAVFLTAALAATVSAQWPTTCVELNDIVEAHLGNDHNVGIYQKTFGDQAEAACRNDHRDDVRSVFAWAIGGSEVTPPAPQATPQATPAPVITNWSYTVDEDEITGEKSDGVLVRGSEGSRLIVLCDRKNQRPSIGVYFGEYAYLLAYDDELPVQWRWNNDEQVNTGIWPVVGDSYFLSVPKWQIPEIGNGLVNAGRLAIRATEDDGDREDAVFNLVGAGAPNHPVRTALQACGITV